MLAAAQALLPSLPALANPSGGRVIGGNATIHTHSATQLEVRQTSDRAILEWDSFSIGSGEHTHFTQPTADAIALNRVRRGGAISEIFGQLSADGRVVLVNGAGIYFGPGARVDVGGLVATTADVDDAAFLGGSGSLAFAGGGGGAVANAGSITVRDAGLAALVAPWVENTGVIEARLGRIVLASGEAFTLDLAGDGLLEIALPDSAASALRRGVESAGLLVADGGEIALLSADGARSALDGAINLTGVARARTIENHAGRIVLGGGSAAPVRVSGTLDATGRDVGAVGGGIDVTGGAITLAAGALLDVSGAAGGGRIRVGGDFQGTGDLLRAQSLAVESGAALRADALASGAGGRIIAWSGGHTEFAGSLSALGRGDRGGFAEVSGHQALTLTGEVSLGAGGELLLDPIEIIVGDLPGATISTTDVRKQLVAGTTVSLLATDDIQILSTIDGRATSGATAGGGLTLRSTAGNILIDADVITNQGAISLDAALDVRMAPNLGALSGGTGTALVVSNGAGALGSADISILAGGDVSTQFLATRGSVVLDAGDALTVNRDLGTITNPLAALTATAGGALDAPSNIVVANGAVTLTAGGALALGLADQILVSTAAGSSTPGVGAITLRYGAGDLDVGTLATAGPLSLAYTGAGVSKITLHDPLGGTNSPLGGLDVDAPVVDVAAEIVAQGDVRLGRLGASGCAPLTGCTILRRSIFTRGGDFEVRSEALVDPRRALVDSTGAPLLVTPVIGVDDAGNLIFGAQRPAAAIEELAVSSFTPVTISDDINNPTEFFPFAERTVPTLVQNNTAVLSDGSTLQQLFPMVFQESKINQTGQGFIGTRVETTWKVTIDTTSGNSSGDVIFRSTIGKPGDSTATQFTGFLPASAAGKFLQPSAAQFFSVAGWAQPGTVENPFTSVAAIATSVFEFFELGVAAGSSAVRFEGGIASAPIATNQLQLNIQSAGSLAFSNSLISQISALRIPRTLLGLDANPVPPALDDFSEPDFYSFRPVTDFADISEIVSLRLTPTGLIAFDESVPLDPNDVLVGVVRPRVPISTLPSTGTFTSTPRPGGGGLGAGGSFSFSGGGSGLFGGFSDLGVVPDGFVSGGDVAAFAPGAESVAEEDPAAAGGADCPQAAPSVYQATPGQAAFGSDGRGGPFSVDAFCGAYRLVETAESGGAHYADLRFVTGDFWETREAPAAAPAR